ncbi:MAG TPA: hypothetical protein VHX65_01980 [Pirellulales bacterium]|jgi:hypothetical protein|nr:hypothetical protein [Pirellulales bacterium]
MNRTKLSFFALLLVNLVVLGVLGLYQPKTGLTQEAAPPFANAVEQRNEIIAQLKEINAQLHEQNELLHSGNMKVLVSLDKKE